MAICFSLNSTYTRKQLNERYKSQLRIRQMLYECVYVCVLLCSFHALILDMCLFSQTFNNFTYMVTSRMVLKSKLK